MSSEVRQGDLENSDKILQRLTNTLHSVPKLASYSSKIYASQLIRFYLKESL